MLFAFVQSTIKMGRTMLPNGTWGNLVLDHWAGSMSLNRIEGPAGTRSGLERAGPFPSWVNSTTNFEPCAYLIVLYKTEKDRIGTVQGNPFLPMRVVTVFSFIVRSWRGIRQSLGKFTWPNNNSHMRKTTTTRSLKIAHYRTTWFLLQCPNQHQTLR